MSWLSIPISNRLGISRGWEQGHFPYLRREYANNFVFWYKMYCFIKLMLRRMNLELLNYEIKITNNGVLVLYINIQHLYKRPTKVKILHQQTPYQRRFIRYKAQILGFATFFKFFTFLVLNKKKKSIYAKSNSIIILTKKDIQNWLIRTLVKKPKYFAKITHLTTFLRHAKLAFQPFSKKWKIYNFYKNLFLNSNRTSIFLPLHKKKINCIFLKKKDKRTNIQQNWIQRNIFKKKILLKRIRSRNIFLSKLYYPKKFLKHWRRSLKKTLSRKIQTLYYFKNKIIQKKLEKEFKTTRFFKKELQSFYKNAQMHKIMRGHDVNQLFFKKTRPYNLKKKNYKKQIFILKKYFLLLNNSYLFNNKRTISFFFKKLILNPKVKPLMFNKTFYGKQLVKFFKDFKNLTIKKKSFEEYLSFLLGYKKYSKFPKSTNLIKIKGNILKKYARLGNKSPFLIKAYIKYLFNNKFKKKIRLRIKTLETKKHYKTTPIKTRGGAIRKKVPFHSYKYEKKLKWYIKRNLTILKWPIYIWFFKIELILNKLLLKLFNLNFLIKFTQNLHKLVSTRKLLWKIEHSYYYNYQKYRNFQFYKFVIRSFFSLYRYGNIYKVTDQIRFYLERIKRKHTYPIRGFTTLFRILKPGRFMFFKLIVTGKVNYRTRACTYIISQGGIPLNRFNTQMNYSQAVANAKAGSFTIRLTTYNMTVQDTIK